MMRTEHSIPSGLHRSELPKRSRRTSHNQTTRCSPPTSGPIPSFSQSPTGFAHAVPRRNGTKSCSPRDSPTSYFSGSKFMTAPPASSLPSPPVHWLAPTLPSPRMEKQSLMNAPKVVVLDPVLAKLFGVAALTTPAACAQEVRSLCEILPTKAKATPTKA